MMSWVLRRVITLEKECSLAAVEERAERTLRREANLWRNVNPSEYMDSYEGDDADGESE